ncbi:hypothetical protein AMECASPLE_002147 [Ameca splendens]|uniref:Uncharacterized protein n=1 Tax=Ameca splendens TaxID=208324 RepID=A0ABV0XM68_9TELE
MFAPMLQFFIDHSSKCVCKTLIAKIKKLAPFDLNSLPHLLAGALPPSSRFSIVNEQNRWERGLLVLIDPGGSLGITINSQLQAYSTGLHRHCQFVPIRGPSFCVGCKGAEQATSWSSHPGPALALTTCCDRYSGLEHLQLNI